MLDVRCQARRNRVWGRLSLLSPKILPWANPKAIAEWSTVFGLDHVSQGTQLFRVLNVIATGSSCKCGCSRCDQVVPGVLSSSRLGQSSEKWEKT